MAPSTSRPQNVSSPSESSAAGGHANTGPADATGAVDGRSQRSAAASTATEVPATRATCHADAEAARHAGRGDERARDAAGAEECVKCGHDRSVVPILDRDGLRVHRDVQEGVERTQERQRRRHLPRGRRDDGERQHEAESDGGDRGDAATAPACDQPRSERQGEHGADSHGQQHEAEAIVAEPVLRLDGGDVRNPARQHRPVDEEDGRHRPPRLRRRRGHNGRLAAGTVHRSPGSGAGAGR